MVQRVFILVVAIGFMGCAELQNAVNKWSVNELTQEQIGHGLRQALALGIENQVSKLAASGGFYRNDLVKILLPKELQVVDQALRKMGLNSLADEGIKALNSAAEDAVKTGTPIFVEAVKEITFTDAKKILLGEKNAATFYLQEKTRSKLYQSFNPVIKNSFTKVGADRIWSKLIDRYNAIPLITKVNPDLSDYVTTQALKGVFTMIELEEKEIRKRVNLRRTTLLKQVFSVQDNI
jgi:hypothetical protein